MANRKDRSGKNRYVQKHKENDRSAAATRHINLGAVVFMIIFIYIVIVLVNFALRERVNYTIAETGVLSHSALYDGLVLRDETIYEATDSGHIKYFLPEGARVRNNNPVFGIISDPSMVAILDEDIFKATQSLSTDDPMFDESYDYLKSRVRNHVINHYHQPYSYTYVSKKQIENDIAEIRNTVILQSDSSSEVHLSSLQNQYDDSITMVNSNSSGLVSYKIDGMENVGIDDFNLSDLNAEIEIQDTSTKTMTEKGQPVFKVVNNYLWYIVAEIDDECEKQIEGKSYISVNFVDKGIEHDVKVYDMYDKDDKTYLILEIDRMINEFLTDRHVDFRITYENYAGIKIPETAVTEKIFAVIPGAYLSYFNKRYVVLKKVYSEDAPGEETIQEVPVKIFKRVGDLAYVPIEEQIKEGDVLIHVEEGSSIETDYTIDKTEAVEGVYVINKGYALFKFIDTQYKEMGYRIVDGNSTYGVRVYDRIATEADTTSEYEIIN